ncbi:MAG: HlyD family efflux transporter periplasmic adaptor subunit [Leptolyngbya sp. PLA1]|nr:HlyD family efflux transporter periplasmic adaptor subunit [Leptolyngbya sp. PLA1]
MYAARGALTPRIAVHIAAVVPKQGANGASDGSQGAGAESTHAAQVVAQAPGWVEPAPFPIVVPALAEGVVREVLVLEGEAIEVGQVVARLVDEDARLGLRAAEAKVLERTADVARSEAMLATAESVVRVEELAAAELRDEVTRKRDLVGIGGVSEGELRRLEIRLSGMEARVVSASRGVDEARAGIAQARASLEAAMVEKDTASLALSRTEIRSPAAGVVMARLVEPGSRLSMGSASSSAEAGMSGAILRIYDPSRLQVRVDVPISDAAGVGLGTRATVTTEALPDLAFAGVVSRVVHEANIQRNTVQFKVALEAPSPVLKPEMLTRVKLYGRGQRSGLPGSGSAESGAGGDVMLLIPRSAVTELGDGRARVWVVDRGTGQPKAASREIRIADSSEGGFVVATAGMAPTDRVIIEPQSHPGLKEGALLRLLGEPPAKAGEENP